MTGHLFFHFLRCTTLLLLTISGCSAAELLLVQLVMTSLFSSKNSNKNNSSNLAEVEQPLSSASNSRGLHKLPDGKEQEQDSTFSGLGLTQWITQSCKAMGFRRPTPIQQVGHPRLLDKNINL